MALLNDEERRFAQAVADVAYCNPFLPQRMEAERRALGDAYVPSPPVWSVQPDQADDRPNIALLAQRVQPLVDSLRQRLLHSRAAPAQRDLIAYEDLVFYLLYDQCRHELHRAIGQALQGHAPPARFRIWRHFAQQFEHYLRLPELTMPSGHEAAHVFACCFQIRRAFSHTFHYLVGQSMPAARLRASVWQSIFTHDLRRYHSGLYSHLADYPTLITGESGTGKELVARAIGFSRYIPFDPQREQFRENFAGSFFALNLSALSPTLIESELFGHKRGAFTGAVADRQGWLEACPPLGTVFLDEIGDLDPAIQVKLLRVLQDRTFQGLGDTHTRRFDGKIIAATNRDLSAQMAAGRFRRDFFYRLCADQVHTPSLREQLDDSPGDLAAMVRFVARRVAGEHGEHLAPELNCWIEQHLRSYPWPGNFRELEQCVRNLVIRGCYQPPQLPPPAREPAQRLLDLVRTARAPADHVLQAYAAWVYECCGNYSEAARRLGLDRRTVARYVTAATEAAEPT
jgi:transcriptional regulator with AAA-type ATPase domain